MEITDHVRKCNKATPLSCLYLFYVTVVEKSGRLLKRCGWKVASIGVASQNFELVLITSPVQYSELSLKCHEILDKYPHAPVQGTGTKNPNKTWRLQPMKRKALNVYLNRADFFGGEGGRGVRGCFSLSPYR